MLFFQFASVFSISHNLSYRKSTFEITNYINGSFTIMYVCRVNNYNQNHSQKKDFANYSI